MLGCPRAWCKLVLNGCGHSSTGDREPPQIIVSNVGGAAGKPTNEVREKSRRGRWPRRRRITEIVCIQNLYNVAQRGDDQFIDDLATQGIAYVPYFPLGGFSPVQSAALDGAAASLHATPMQIALAWLLQRAPNILLIPGTSSIGHLRENLAAATLELPPKAIAELDRIASAVSRAT